MQAAELIQTDSLHYKTERHDGEAVAPWVPQDMLNSIRSLGIVNPLLISEDWEGELYVYIGNQRLAAARMLGIGQVPCRFVNSQEEVEAALAEYDDA